MYDIWQAASADEKALVEASARCGVILQKDTNEEMEINVNRKIMVFNKLEVLEFSSGTWSRLDIDIIDWYTNYILYMYVCIYWTERKRMSVIVKDTADDYWLYCKGADSAVLPLIISGKLEEAVNHVADFSMVRYISPTRMIVK